jgi:hypothetical protein
MEAAMRPPVLLGTVLTLGCLLTKPLPLAQPVPVWVHSHNRSAVDVYLSCDGRTSWLGAVEQHGSDAREVPVAHTSCVRGLNFFLLVRRAGRGYWTGPVQATAKAHVELVIRRYAGLSTAQMIRD